MSDGQAEDVDLGQSLLQLDFLDHENLPDINFDTMMASILESSPDQDWTVQRPWLPTEPTSSPC